MSTTNAPVMNAWTARLAGLGLALLTALGPALPARADGPKAQAAPATAHAAPPRPHAAPPRPCSLEKTLLGAWKPATGPKMIRFVATGGRLMYATATGGRLDGAAPVVACAPDHVTVCAYGRRLRLDLKRTGGRLDVHNERSKSHHVYRRLSSVPKVFDLKPLVLPPAHPLSAKRLAAIRKALAQRLARDQAGRHNPDRKKLDFKKVMQIDADNTAYLERLVTKVGWIDAHRFGKKAALAAFLVVQHSGDLPLMLAALQALRRSGPSVGYALLYDRVQIRLGRRQRYGTQVGWSARGKAGLLPIEPLKGIDQRRARVGLGPLDAYLAHFGVKGRPVLDCGAP